MVAFAVGDPVRYVGGGRFTGPQVFENRFGLKIGECGIIHSIPGSRGELGCTFGNLKVSLDIADVRDVRVGRKPATRGRSGGLMMRSGSCPTSQPVTPLSRNLSKPRQMGLPAGNLKEGTASHARLRVPRTLPPLKAWASASHDEEQDGSEEGGSEVSTESERPHPPSFYCPISRQCMHDPVVLTDGHTYERRHIEQWLTHKDTSPVSGAQLVQKAVFPNHALRNAIEEYFEQVLLTHRQSIRQKTAGLFRQQGKFKCDSTLLNTIDALMQCSVLVNADFSIELVLERIMEEAKHLVGAEVASVFLVDRHRRELYSTVNSTDSELRIPFDSGVAGYVACSGDPLIIKDAYDDSRFNTEIDRKTGFKTRNILCVPIKSRNGIIGVAELINKTTGGVLPSSMSDEMDFTLDDQLFFELLASQAGSAVVNSGIFQRMPSAEREASPPKCTSPVMLRCRSKTRQLLVADDVRDASSDAPVEVNLAVRQDAFSPCKIREGSPVARVVMSAAQLSTVKPFLKAAWACWETDTLALAELTDNKPLSTLTLYLFEQHGLISHFDLDKDKLECFLAEIEEGYPDVNPYHNRSHAASVVHFTHALLLHGGLAEVCSHSAVDIDDGSRRQFVILASLLAAVIHDFEHNGLSNDFHVNCMSDKAITYNDRHVNEQHHSAAAFRTLLKPECNFLKAMEAQNFRQLRSLVLDLVLATDPSENNQILEAFKETTLAAAGGSHGESAIPASAEGARVVLKVSLKCADLGHLALSWGSHMRWVRRLEEEFYQQGDKEKLCGMPKVSFLMDRNKPGVSQSQMGFFDFVVLPLFRSFGHAFPSAGPMVEAVEQNYQRWCDVQADLFAVA
mmetsp:Transcript_131627/g.281451  ORF Transcript_131627/g.281451 Transcript_131627/m.281451 type:complete len:850 (+) Transcript_131627:75-2624(+)